MQAHALIFGEIIPKTFMRNHGEKVVIPITIILRSLYIALFPVVKLFIFIIKSVLGEHASLQEKMITKDDIEFIERKLKMVERLMFTDTEENAYHRLIDTWSDYKVQALKKQ